MKFYSSGLTDLINKIEKGSIQTILIYGVNQGFATTAIQQITTKLNLRVNNFTNSKKYGSNSISLPTHQFIRKKMIDRIIKVIKDNI